MKRLLLLMMIAALTAVCQAGLLTWTGAGDGVSTFSEANWDLDGGGPPPDLTIEKNIAVEHDMLVDIAASVGGGGATGNLVLADGKTLSVSAGTVKMAVSQYAIKGVDGGDTSYINISGTGKIVSKYLSADLTVTLGGEGILSLAGGGNPINGTTVDFTSMDAQLLLTSETLDDFTAEHLGKITVNGLAAVIGSNLSVVSDGETGCIVTAIPEPATMALLSLGSLALLRKRK